MGAPLAQAIQGRAIRAIRALPIQVLPRERRGEDHRAIRMAVTTTGPATVTTGPTEDTVMTMAAVTIKP